jgi:hypothetical protein
VTKRGRRRRVYSTPKAERERVLFIGTQFSNLYTAVDTPARGRERVVNEEC